MVSQSQKSTAPTGAGGRVRRIELVVRPTDRFAVPTSDGYPLYGALLSVLDDADETVSSQVHDSGIGSLHCSGLQGVFGGSDRPHHKTLLPDRKYEITLGVVDPDDEAIFQALVERLVIEGATLALRDGQLHVESFESVNATRADLLERTNELDDPSLELTFRTATCIEEADGVTTMFPHRVPVFQSLLGKWNATCPDELELELSRQDLLANVIEKPETDTYETHSVLVSRGETDAGETRNIFRQGFTGTVAYEFKGASEAVENAVVALGSFGEYSGVGSAVSRGCGNVNVRIQHQ